MTNLTPTFRFGSLDLAAYPFAVAFGSDRGSPEQLVVSVQSALRDGSLTKVTGYDNRTVTMQVLIEGVSQAAMAVAEGRLVAEAMKPRNEFTFNPGDGTAADAVYDTFEADVTLEPDEVYELNGTRLFTLTFQALPWPRSAGMINTPAVTRVAPTVLDAGTATTNWTTTKPAGATLSVVSGAVTATYNPNLSGGGEYGVRVRRAFPAPINVSANKYIAIDWKASVPSLFTFQGVNGGAGGNLAEVRRDLGAAGYTRSWYKLSDATTSLTEFAFHIVHPPNSAASATLSIDQVLLANELPASGSLRQTSRTIFPGGNVPAEGTVVVQHATSGLGQTIVFSHPTQGGYSPPLRQWRVASSTVIADANSVSGFQNPLDATMSFVIPAASIPRGDVHLWARVVRPTAGLAVINGAAFSSASTGAGAYVGDSQPFSVQNNFPANQWVLLPIARLTLPTAEVGAAGGVQIDMIGTGLTIDEAWLFAMDKGRLTVLDCGTGTPVVGSVSNRLRIEAPSLDKPFGGILVGTAADWSNAHTPSAATVQCDQTGHRFNPEGSAVHVVTAGPTTESSVSFEHYPRWHSNAGAA